jgi:hypothetical protein
VGKKPKPKGEGILKIRGPKKVVGKSGLAFWEYPSHTNFTHCKAQDKCYHGLKPI